ncbi:hypothetical protein [Taibaiella koreensis]|uniref:hypothetical protein n=1 Tax=Taibaiella koreensis TaxID=1268548 RepID=UPI0013C31B25|nr:hypothetical protein [Taibaiella koreensis]
MNLRYFRLRQFSLLKLGITFAFLTNTLAGHAQTVTAQVGNGTTSSANIPLTTRYGYSYSQQIYTVPDLNAAGAIAGANIQKVRFYLESGPAVTNSSDWTVYIGHSSKTQFVSNTDWEAVGNLTQVFSGTVSFPANGNWMEIALTAPFSWNGTGNLIVAVDENTPNFTSNNNFWRTTSTLQNRAIYFRSDGIDPSPASPPAASGLLSSANNIQFDFVQQPCSGTPAPGATLAASGTICEGNASQLSLQNNYTAFSGMSYQWQSSANGTNGWQNINNATNPYYQAMPGTTTWYRALLSCGSNTGSSTPVIMTVNPRPNVTVNGASMIYCTGAAATITASGASGYSWAPATGLNTDTGATILATPAMPSVYIVTGTDANGCQDTASVQVAPVASFRPTAMVSPAISCSTGTPVTVTVGNAPSAGAMLYQLNDTAGNVIVPWQSAATFVFTPATAGNLKYLLLARASACSQDADTATVNVFYGFSANVGVVTNCSGTGNMLVVGDPQGASVQVDTWQQSFGTTALPVGTTLQGGALVADGRAVITPSATSQKGGMTIAGFGTANPKTIALSFLLTADQPINNFGTGGADGIAWSFGDDAGFTSSITNGAGSRLRLVFDAANNGTENGNTAGIYLTYGYTANTQMGPASTGVLAYSSDMSWKVQTDKPVSIIIDEDSKLTLSYNGNIIFNHIQLPPAFAAANKSQWKHLFSAFTGGDALRFAIDELSIRYTRQDFVFGLSPGGSGQLPASWQTAGSFTNLTAPDSFDVWIGATDAPASCNKLLGTYGFHYPVAISNVSHTGPSACGVNDGTITLEGLISGLAYNVAYTKDNLQNVSVAMPADTLGHIVLNNLSPGFYSGIAVSLDSCTGMAAGPVIIPEIERPLINVVVSDTNSGCATPNGAISVSSTGFVNGASYEIWYNGTLQGSRLPDGNQQIRITGLPTGNYDQIYVVSPQLCPSDTITTITMPGVLPPAVITGLNVLTTPGCAGSGGSVRLMGTFNPGTAQINFRRNGIWSTAVAVPDAGGLTLSGLTPAVYDSIQIAGSCASNYWGPLTLSGAASPASIATGSITKADIQGPGVSVAYISNSCELIAGIQTTNDSLGAVTVKVGVLDSTMIQGGQPYVGRYYDITAGNNAGGMVTLYFKDAEFDHYNTTVAAIGNSLFPAIGPAGENLQITAYHTPGAGTGPQGYNTTGAEVIVPSAIVHHTTGNYWEVTFHTNSFSGFFAHTNLNGSPLPVRLGDVTAINLGVVNRIDWHTTMEARGDMFTIERSADGRQFSAIGSIAAQGAAGSSYHFTDEEPIAGLNYYRIKVRNNDGRSFYSKVVQVRMSNGQLLITTAPNPVSDELAVTLTGSRNGGMLLLMDASSRLIDRRNVSGDGRTLFSMKGLSPGLYLLIYREGSISRRLKVIRQ